MRFTGRVVTTVQRPLVRAVGHVATTVRPTTIRATGRVVTTVEEETKIRAVGRVRTTVRGPGLRIVGHVAATVRPFTGTGVHRSRTVEPTRGAGHRYPTVVPDPPPAVGDRFLGHAFWTTPLEDDAPVAATSAAFVERLAFQAALSKTSVPVHFAYNPPFNTRTSSSAYSICVYTMPPDTPRVPVWSRSHKGPLQDYLDAGVPVPDPGLIPDGAIAPTGTDGSTVIIDPATHELWEFFRFGPAGAGDPDGYDWRCQQGGYAADYRTHPGWWSGSLAFGGGANGRPLGYDWGVAASGHALLGPVLRAEDYYGDAITHPLKLALPITGGTTAAGPGGTTVNRLLPATRRDRMNFVNPGALADPYRIPEGARFRLPAGFDVEGWAETYGLAEASQRGSTVEVLHKILVALRDYGMLNLDSAGVLSIGTENSKVFGTPYHPYSAAEAPVWGNFAQQIPWTSLVQLEPPTVDISVPADGS